MDAFHANDFPFPRFPVLVQIKTSRCFTLHHIMLHVLEIDWIVLIQIDFSFSRTMIYISCLQSLYMYRHT